jgi:hypothetical protein
MDVSTWLQISLMQVSPPSVVRSLLLWIDMYVTWKASNPNLGELWSFKDLDHSCWIHCFSYCTKIYHKPAQHQNLDIDGAIEGYLVCILERDIREMFFA